MADDISQTSPETELSFFAKFSPPAAQKAFKFRIPVQLMLATILQYMV